jgi:hypothetical protein
MQLRPVGIECLGEKLLPEGSETGEQAGLSVMMVHYGARRCDGRHDESCHFFPATSVARSAFLGR